MRYSQKIYMNIYNNMNLQENIRKILREESSRTFKLLNTIESIGFLRTSEIVGGIKKLLNILGEDSITDSIKIQAIKEIILSNEHEYFSIYEINEEPILLDEENGIRKEIYHLFPDKFHVYLTDIYSNKDKGEAYENYKELPNDILDDIFNMLVLHYLENN